MENYILILNTLAEEMQELASAWNGKDISFVHGGILYTEEAAHIAQEIANNCLDIISKLESF